MQNLFLIMAGIVAIALGLFVALVVLQPGNTPRLGADCVIQDGPWKPTPIEGFSFERSMKANAIFEGELNSVTTNCTPKADAPFAARVESFGVTLFNLEKQDAVIEIKSLLTPHIDEKAIEQFTINETVVNLFVNTTEKTIVVFWEEPLKFVYLELAGRYDDPAVTSLDETQMNLYMETLHVVTLEIVNTILGGS